MPFPDQILSLATSRDWAALGLNLILSTIVGGIVIVILLAIFSKAWKEQVKYQNAFLMVILINIINLFGVIGFLSPYIPAALSLFLPLLIWIGFAKGFFAEMKWWQAIVLGIIGYGLSIFLIPSLTAAASGFIPKIR